MDVRDRLRGLAVRLRALVRRSSAERDLREELRFHLEMETEAGIAAGLDPAEARRRARVRFGGEERYREETRDTVGAGWWDDVRRDLRLSVRMLRASPYFSAAAIGTLALGIGANTAIFSVVDAVLLAESPFAEPDRLVMVWETDRNAGNVHEPASWPDVVDFRERSRTLSSVGVVVGRDFTLSVGGEPERVSGLSVTPGLLDLLGVRPVLGRTFSPEEGSAGDGGVVVLSERFWRERYGADPGVLGRTLLLDEAPATVVGVVPSDADLGIRQVHDRADYAPSYSGGEAQLWQAVRPTEEAFPRQTHPFLTLGRLAPGVTAAAAGSELSAIAAELEATYPENEARGVNVEPYSDVVFGPTRPALLILLGAVALVLLIACANVANLLLARTTSRVREVAVRRALGASSSRVRRQFVVEGLVLTALGSVAGIALALVGLELLVAAAPGDIPRLQGAALDGRVLAFTAALSGVVALVFGVLPALESGRVDLQRTLVQSGRRTSGGRGGRRLRSALVVAEVALAVVLVIGSGLLLRSLWELQRVDPGFDTEGVLKAQYQLPSSRYPRDFSRWPDIPEINDFHARLLDRVRSIPGVDAAALAGGHPLDAGFTNSFTIVGREAESAGYPEIRTRFLTAGYLEALGVELLEGRGIRDGDDVSAPPVVVLNRAAADRYFPGGGAVGRQISFWGTARTVVGVMGDERFRGVDAPSEPAAYAPLLQNPQQSATLLVRSAGDPLALAPELRRQLRAMDPRLALYGVEPLESTLSGTLSRPRFTALLLCLFAGVSILLALIGVHGVLSYAVARRRPELGVRVALGASRGAVLRSVVGEGLALAGAGVAAGLIGALAASRLLASLVYGVTPTDPATFAAVTAGVLVTAAAASLLPALRATRVDPIDSLRAE